MNKNGNIHCIIYSLCRNLLSKLEILELKCDQITEELSEVKYLMASLPPEVDTLIDSIKCSAEGLYSQNAVHRIYRAVYECKTLYTLN